MRKYNVSAGKGQIAPSLHLHFFEEGRGWIRYGKRDEIKGKRVLAFGWKCNIIDSGHRRVNYSVWTK